METEHARIHCRRYYSVYAYRTKYLILLPNQRVFLEKFSIVFCLKEFYNAMNDFLEAIQQVILVLKFFQAPQQYDDFPKTLFDQVAP